MGSNWSDIPFDLRVKYQGKAFLLYLIVGGIRTLLFGATFACGWLAVDLRHEPAVACICLLGLVVCTGFMWVDAQSHYEDERRRGPIPRDPE